MSQSNLKDFTILEEEKIIIRKVNLINQSELNDIEKL